MRRPALNQIDAMSGKFMDPEEVEKGRPRELSWANKHNVHENYGAQGDPQVHANVAANKQRQHGQKRTGKLPVGSEYRSREPCSVLLFLASPAFSVPCCLAACDMLFDS